MSIQQDINSALGQVGILASLNPTLQQKAIEGAELRKIKKEEKGLGEQFDAAREDYFKEKDAQTKAEKSEIKANNGKPKALLAPDVYAESLGQAAKNMQDLTAKREALAQKKFDIAPSVENYEQLTYAQTAKKYWEDQQAMVGKPITKEGQKALEAIQRAEQRRENKIKNQERRTKLLYGEMERMMPGFKYMEPKKQNKILKDLGKDERKRIKDEAERREKYYGK